MSADTTPSWQDILDLVTQLDGGAYDTAAVEFGDVSVRLSRTGDLGSTAVTAPTVGHSAPVPATVAPAPAAPDIASTAVATSVPAASAGTTIPAPMIGIFYRCPSPGAPPFVTVGDTVEPETTIGIIEVMKLMNPVTAGVGGILSDILVEDNDQVEYGQPLAVVTETGTP